MIDRQYIEAIAYKHLHKEVLLMDRLVVEERGRWKNPDSFDEQEFRLERAAEWRAISELLRLSSFMDTGHIYEDRSAGEQIEQMRRKETLDDNVNKALGLTEENEAEAV